MLKIFFSGADIARTRLAPAPDPVWELVLSLHLLRSGGRDPWMAHWRRTVTGRLCQDISREQLRLLFAVNPARGYFPDFLTPYDSRNGLDAGMDALRSTPIAVLRRDLDVLAASGPLPPAAAGLARGKPGVLRDLTASMVRYQSVAVDPYWPAIQSSVEADRNSRARALLDGGTEGLLSSLRPAARWNSGILEIPDYPTRRDLHLNGRGLLLVPSFFCAPTPVALRDPMLPPVLVYPVDRLGGLRLASTETAPTAAGRAALAALLGRTRAAVLEATDGGCTTGELACRLGISAAAASQHVSVLRNAGLVTSQRQRTRVLHTLTLLGRTLIDR